MHILFLTDNFPPEVNAPASRTFEHCREWIKLGHKVTVITCAPNFPQGKVFPGYKNKIWQSDYIDGVRVLRVWTYITANEGFLKRTLDYISFMIGAILAAPFVRRVDIVVGTSPHFFTACAAYITGLIKWRPYVFELRDLWPESIKVVGALKNETALRWLESLELFLYRRSRAVVSVTHSFRDNLIARGISADKIEVVTNGADLSRFTPQIKDKALLAELRLEGKFVAGYIGTHGLAHALDTLVTAAEKLRDAGRADIHFLFLGNGAKKSMLYDRAQKLGLKNVTFLDTVPKEDVARYWSLLDASIIHLRKSDLFSTVIPSKLFECMAMGIPVLHGVRGESADIVAHEGAGLLFEPENADDLSKQLLKLADNPPLCKKFAAAGVAAAKKYDRTVLAANMLKLLEAAAGVSGTPRESANTSGA